MVHARFFPVPSLVSPDVHPLQPWHQKVFEAIDRYGQHSVRPLPGEEDYHGRLSAIESAFASIKPQRDLSYATRIALTLCMCTTEFTDDEIANVVRGVPEVSQYQSETVWEAAFDEMRKNVAIMY